MFVLSGGSASNQEVSKVLVAKYGPKCPECLTKNLFAVGDKEKRRSLAARKTLVIKSGNHCLASSGGGDDKMPALASVVPFNLYCIEDFLLERIRPEVKIEP